jgi:hypothetical protein
MLQVHPDRIGLELLREPTVILRGRLATTPAARRGDRRHYGGELRGQHVVHDRILARPVGQTFRYLVWKKQ